MAEKVRLQVRTDNAENPWQDVGHDPTEVPVPVTLGKNSTYFKLLIDDTTTTNVTYLGRALPGVSEGDSVWQIRAIDETGSFPEIEFAGGVSTFTQEWDNRTSLSYS